MAEDNKSLFVLASIVGIVAVVGLVVLIVGGESEVYYATGQAVVALPGQAVATDPVGRSTEMDYGEIELGQFENCEAACEDYYSNPADFGVEAIDSYVGNNNNWCVLGVKGNAATSCLSSDADMCRCKALLWK